MYTSWIVLGAVGCIALKMIQLLAKQSRLKRIMPPSPPGLPLLGHIFQVPQFQWLRFTEWKERYGTYTTILIWMTFMSRKKGSIFSLNFAGQPVVVINDLSAAVEIFGMRFSSSPCPLVMNRPLC